MRRICLLGSCLLLCFAVGCQAKPTTDPSAAPTVSGAYVFSDAEETTSFETAFSVPDPTVSEPSEVSFPTPVQSYLLPCGLTFVADGFVCRATSEEGVLFSARSEDGFCRCALTSTTVSSGYGITEALLLSEAENILRGYWEERSDAVTLTREKITLGTESVSAVCVFAEKNGTQTVQKQLFLFRPDALYLLTVTTEGEDRTEDVLALFENE